MKVKVLGFTHGIAPMGPEDLLEYAGRVCYKTDTRDARKFLQARIREGHESLIEHASITFEIEGISRACSHQLVRHRIGCSFSQESQRYVDMRGPIEFVVPPAIDANEDALEVYFKFLTIVEDVYDELRGMGIRKEDARFVLPNATQTRIVVTMNFRALRHFIKVRCDKAAQWEIRELATKMLHLAYDIAPSVFSDLYEEYIIERGM